MSIPIRLGKSRYTSDDLYVRKGFMNNKSAIRKKINTTPAVESKTRDRDCRFSKHDTRFFAIKSQSVCARL